MARQVLSFHYVLTDAQGKQIDSSRAGKPFEVLEGAQQIIVGLEEELFKMKAGEKKKVMIPTAKAYGPRQENLRIRVGRDKFPAGEIKVGTRFSAGGGQGPVFIVTEITETEVGLDGNHPLAGQDLYFDVEVMGLREATPEEEAHGHAHGPEGHHHHS